MNTISSKVHLTKGKYSSYQATVLKNNDIDDQK